MQQHKLSFPLARKNEKPAEANHVITDLWLTFQHMQLCPLDVNLDKITAMQLQIINSQRWHEINIRALRDQFLRESMGLKQSLDGP